MTTKRTIATASSAFGRNKVAAFKIEEVKEDTNKKAFDNLLKKIEEGKDKENFNCEIKEVFNKYFSSFEESFFYELTISIVEAKGEGYSWIERYGSAIEAYKEMLKFLEGTREVPSSLEDFKKNNPNHYKYNLRHYFEFNIEREKDKGCREEKMKLWEEIPTNVKEAYVKKLLMNNL